MKWEPYPFQEDMLEWLLAHPRAALWAGMGTGKTCVSLTALSTLILEGAARAALVVCPHRCGPTAWEAQIRRWDHLRWMRIHNLRTDEGLAAWERGEGEVFWINSERLPTIEKRVKGGTKVHEGFVDRFLRPSLADSPADVLIIDEASLAKNPKSVRFGALRPFLHDIPDKFRTPFRRQWQLTGTPHAGSYLNVFAQARLLDPTILGRSFYQFRQTYFRQTDWMGYNWELQDGAKERIDERMSRVAMVVSSEEVLDLPGHTVEDVDVELPAAARSAYRRLEKDLLLPLAGGDVSAPSAAALTNKLLQATGGCLYRDEGGVALLHDAKVKALRKVLKKHAGEPVIVVAQYISERKRLLAEVEGAVEFHEREIPRWRRGEIPVFIAQAAQMAHGIDGLQDGGRVVVWHTPPWSWELYVQLIHRLVRPGQKREAIVYRLLATSTIDWAVAQVLHDKEEGERGLLAAVRALQQLRTKEE